ncbi:hypothetical protein LSTR_LSTR014425 [Laodelphax striatellus]|uniref:RRM domain-containing protein n=1 Tax=Laodelphax striatellus TaxID=195883 RepID=A0A482XW30_LAOST|nr:hypothetical protein LSTR_LSTR014425 [Laodelphax striatellus]
MTLNVPYKFSAEGREYLGCEVQDSVCQAVLRQSYAMAHLFMGPFTQLLDSENPDDKSLSVIKLKLEKFYNKYLHSLHLEHCDILDVFQGVQFLPLDKTTFLQVQCFVNHVQVAFSNIEFSIFLFNEHLVWSGLEPEELQVVFRYLVNSLLLSQAEKDHQNGITSQLNTIIPRGNFITGPSDLQKPFNGNSMNKIPLFHLKRSQQSTSVYQMVVYKFQNATLCLFYKSTTSLTTDSFRVLDDFLSPRLRKLSSEVADYLTRQSAVSSLNDSSSRFVYFNRMNLATKSSIHLDNRRSGNISVPVEVLRLLADINSTTENKLSDHFKKFGEIIDLQLLRRVDNKLVGCGFVEFNNKQSAAKAILETSGKPFLENGKQ